MFLQILITIITFSSLTILSSQCQIAGKQIGICQNKQIFQNYKQSFCGQIVLQLICIPITSKTWYNLSTIQYRDRQIQDIFMYYIQNRLLSQYIYMNTTIQILSNNQKCYNSYKKFLCQFNFPQCDQNTKKTKPICRSICVTFFQNCLSSEDACDIIYMKKLPGLDPNC